MFGKLRSASQVLESASKQGCQARLAMSFYNGPAQLQLRQQTKQDKSTGQLAELRQD